MLIHTYKKGNWTLEHSSFFSNGRRTDHLELIELVVKGKDKGMLRYYPIIPKLKITSNPINAFKLNDITRYSDAEYERMFDEGVKSIKEFYNLK